MRLPGGGTGVVESRSDSGTAIVRALDDNRLITLPWWLVRPVEDA